MPPRCRRPLPLLAFGSAAAALSVLAQPAPPSDGHLAPYDLPPMLVRGESASEGSIQNPFLPAAVGPAIYEGKKTSVIDFDRLPRIQTDNYRQAFAQVPGLLTSELPNASLLSLGYRGIGDPHESQNLLVLKDGIPFSVDMFGYPTVYYAPPFESMDRLEFVRGGASLLYGPQPGGALNYVTHAPRRDREFGASTQHIFGSYGLYSTFNQLEGTVDRLGYLAFFDHRQGDTFRERNGDFDLNGGNARLVWDASDSSRWQFDLDIYDADSGEPGGLTFGTTPRSLNYDADRARTLLFHDRVRIERYVPTLQYDHQWNEETLLTAKAWGGFYSRYSKRQNGAGFGLAPTGNNNTINLHEYTFLGADVRLRHDWEWNGDQQTLTAGFTAYHSDSPITNRRGDAPDADDGVETFRADRSSAYGAPFVEHLFRHGRWSLTPAFRLECLSQDIDEKLNAAKTAAGTPLGSQEDFDLVPLLALGSAYDLGRDQALYANVSQGYKPRTYADAVPTGANDTVSDHLDPAHAITYEFGWRGTPVSWLAWDTSLFLIDYDDRFGRVGSNLQNVGRSINQGWDAALEIDLIGLYDRLAGAPADRPDKLSLYGNVELLDAQFVSGPLDGKRPQYAPDHLVRTGLVYRRGQRFKVALLGTFVGQHWANDNNGLFNAADPNSSGRIPAYMVWDLTVEAAVWRDRVSVLAGLNNLLDEDYYSRIRSNGIDPAVGRNVYAGLRLEF